MRDDKLYALLILAKIFIDFAVVPDPPETTIPPGEDQSCMHDAMGLKMLSESSLCRGGVAATMAAVLIA